MEEAKRPVGLRLRHNPPCKEVPKVGIEVVDVVPAETIHSRIISPMLIAREFRRRFDTLISIPQGSGSGLFDAERKCLLGIMSAKIQKDNVQKRDGVFLLRRTAMRGILWLPLRSPVSYLQICGSSPGADDLEDIDNTRWARSGYSTNADLRVLGLGDENKAGMVFKGISLHRCLIVAISFLSSRSRSR